MKHATEGALDQIEPLLVRLRGLDQLKERKRGVFYLRSKAFLHFHEDPTGLYADIRLADSDFERFKIDGAEEQAALMTLAVEAAARRDRR